MAEWNAGQYLLFEDQRSRPAMDLVHRLRGLSPKTALDLGCGPGNSTKILQEAFPAAAVVGVDSSEGMIAQARKSHPDLEFSLGDVGRLEGRYDILFSNACLQWVPDHAHLIPRLIEDHLTDGGVLAVQMPMNGAEPLFQIIDRVAGDPQWGLDLGALPPQGTLAPDGYYDLLGRASAFQMWETTYYHPLAGHRELVEWVKGSRLRPYLAQLDEGRRAAFENEIEKRAREAYPVRKDGKVVLRFRRFFFTAVK